MKAYESHYNHCISSGKGISHQGISFTGLGLGIENAPQIQVRSQVATVNKHQTILSSQLGRLQAKTHTRHTHATQQTREIAIEFQITPSSHGSSC